MDVIFELMTDVLLATNAIFDYFVVLLHGNHYFVAICYLLCLIIFKYVMLKIGKMDVEDQIICLMIIYWYLKRHFLKRIPRIMDHTSILSEHTYMLELLRGSKMICHELRHLSCNAYVLLCNHFKRKQWVQNSRYITIEEKMTIFLTIISYNERFRVVKRRFQHST